MTLIHKHCVLWLNSAVIHGIVVITVYISAGHSRLETCQKFITFLPCFFSFPKDTTNNEHAELQKLYQAISRILKSRDWDLHLWRRDQDSQKGVSRDQVPELHHCCSVKMEFLVLLCRQIEFHFERTLEMTWRGHGIRSLEAKWNDSTLNFLSWSISAFHNCYG